MERDPDRVLVQQEEFLAGTVHGNPGGGEPGRSDDIVLAGLHVEGGLPGSIRKGRIVEIGVFVVQAHFDPGDIDRIGGMLEFQLHGQMPDGRLLAVAGDGREQPERTKQEWNQFLHRLPDGYLDFRAEIQRRVAVIGVMGDAVADASAQVQEIVGIERDRGQPPDLL